MRGGKQGQTGLIVNYVTIIRVMCRILAGTCTFTIEVSGQAIIRTSALMSVKHQALPKVSAMNPPARPNHALVELFAIMTWWERISFGFVIGSTVACFIMLVLLLEGQL